MSNRDTLIGEIGLLTERIGVLKNSLREKQSQLAQLDFPYTPVTRSRTLELDTNAAHLKLLRLS